MKNFKKNLPSNIVILMAVLLIAVCFLTTIGVVESYAKAECFDHIEEATVQVSDMFSHAIQQSQTQLALFADILATNSSNPDAQLRAYMEVFCDTQNFSAVCIHKADGTSFSYGFHPHDEVTASFTEELSKLPYISDVQRSGNTRKESYVYLATPIVRGNAPIAILYGYISLDTFPTFLSSTAYDGKSQFYIVDGNTGDFLMDEYHRYDRDGSTELPLGNAFDGSMGNRETKPGYTMEAMRDGIRNGESGYFIFRSQRTGQWYYTYFMPMGINAWSMQITIDEPTAFEAYHAVRNIVLVLMVGVVCLCLAIIVLLVLQNRRKAAQEARNLHRADYLNKIQSALLTAHNNPDFVDRALRLVAKEMQAETALLLTFEHKVIRDVYYWPSEDKTQANALIGLNVKDMFPTMFDALMSNENFFCEEASYAEFLTQDAAALFKSFDIRNILLVPVANNAGIPKGTLAAINMGGGVRTAEMLECTTRDFFMAITNLENHNIIKRMGAIDYLTGIKNRNSYEAELANYETATAENLWCVFVDVNGLHELNNSQGHKAGDTMLCTVADALKKVFGEANCYRLGGDEFVAFRTDCSHEELMNCKYRLLDTLSKKGYSVSVGFAGSGKNENNVFDVEDITDQAEKIMYREKRKYYTSNGISTDRKYFPPEQQTP